MSHEVRPVALMVVRWGAVMVQVSGSTDVGGAIGSAAGAVGGRAGRGAMIGAASGATAGFLRGLFRRSPPSNAYKQFVLRCLMERGYDPVGWE